MVYLVHAALTDGFTCGAAGYARHTMLTMSAWPAELFHPDIAVTVLFGASDTPPDLRATLTNRIHRARRHPRRGGGSLIWAVICILLYCNIFCLPD
jgi:hypothetical protein